METAKLQEKIQSHIGRLSAERLQVVLDFLRYLTDREENEATQELLSIPNFREELAEAKKEIEEGDVYDWKDLRNDV